MKYALMIADKKCTIDHHFCIIHHDQLARLSMANNLAEEFDILVPLDKLEDPDGRVDVLRQYLASQRCNVSKRL
jgi:hypothetical protein